jgi:hypothetical protein
MTWGLTSPHPTPSHQECFLGQVNKLGLATNTQILLWGVKLLFKTFSLFFWGGCGATNGKNGFFKLLILPSLTMD